MRDWLPSSPWRKSDRAEMGAAGPAARREEGEYSPYLTDEQRSRRAGSAHFGDGRLLPRAARCRAATSPCVNPVANAPVRVLGHLLVRSCARALARARADGVACFRCSPTSATKCRTSSEIMWAVGGPPLRIVTSATKSGLVRNIRAALRSHHEGWRRRCWPSCAGGSGSGSRSGSGCNLVVVRVMTPPRRSCASRR